MNHREATLANLLTNIDIIHGDLTYTRHHWQPTRGRGNFLRTLCKTGKIGLDNLFLKRLYLRDELAILALLFFQLVLEVLYAGITATSRLGSLHS